MIPRETVFLVVDDVNIMRSMTVSLLRAARMEHILSAANGREALQILERQHVDIVLSDWNMPVMTGLELLKALRENPRTASTPFVMITVDAARERVSEAIAAGVTDLVIKPFTSGQLLDRIDKVMARQKRTAPPAPPAAAPAPRVQAPSQPPTVLVVDDTPVNLQLNYELLKDEFRVRTASSGPKALEICHSENPPDLVLLDVMMPGMDGFEVAQQLRNHPNSETIPVIFVTAKTDEESRMKGLELGAVDFVAKPIDPSVLLPRVRNFMRYVALQKQLQANADAMMEAAQMREGVELMTRHDLGKPLAEIAGMAQALAARPGLNDVESKQADQIADAIFKVIDTINLSTEIFNIELGRSRPNIQPVDVGQLLARAAEAAMQACAGKAVDIALDSPDNTGKLVALADPMFCHTIFHRLIRGACEKAPAQAHVAVTAACNDRIQINLTMPGSVPAALRDQFFKKRAGNEMNDGAIQGGYEVKLLTEAQGGQVDLQASEGEDRTTVTVSLPKAK